MVFNPKTFWFVFLTCFLFAAMSGCSQKNVPIQTADPQLSANELWRLGLDKADARDYSGALADVALAQKKDPQLKYELAVAHLQFLNKDYRSAVKGYEKIIASGKLNKTQEETLAAEVDRVKSSKGDVTGRSVAGKWVRAIVAVVAAEEAFANQNYTGAYKNYDKAYQYNSDYELLLESALAASVAKQWDWAYKKYKEYLAVGGDDITRDMQYRIIAETDRIMALMKGEQVVTLKSLADEIYAERSGEEEADGLPPSMSAGEGEGDTHASVAAAQMVTDTDSVSDTDDAMTASLPDDSGQERDQVAANQITAQDEAERAENARTEEEARLKAEADAAREAARAEKHREREAAAEQAKLARERRLALKKEREEKKKAAQAAKKQREAERKAALEAKREADKKRRAEEKAKKAEEKQRLAEERRQVEEARAKEREIARQEAEAARLEKEAEREAEAARREAEKEKLKEEKRLAAEVAREEAEAKRAAAKEARRQAVEERKRLKEERRLAKLAKAEEKRRRREEAKRTLEAARQKKAEEKRRKAEERKALAEQKRHEREEEKRIAAEQRRAEQEEKRAEKARRKAERELAKQEQAHQKALEKQQAASAKEARLARAEGGKNVQAATNHVPGASEANGSANNVAKSTVGVATGNRARDATTVETTFDDLLFYAESKSATVRFRAVKELIPLINERSRIALENRVISDRNIHVRFLAIGGLAERRSIKSLPVLEHALITAATSQERAVLKNAISVIRLGLE